MLWHAQAAELLSNPAPAVVMVRTISHLTEAALDLHHCWTRRQRGGGSNGRRDRGTGELRLSFLTNSSSRDGFMRQLADLCKLAENVLLELLRVLSPRPTTRAGMAAGML